MKKRVTWSVIATASLLLVLVCILMIKEAPRFVTAKISGVLISKDWQTNSTDRIRLSGNDFTCQPDDGKQWACAVLLEGKPLEMTASYSLSPQTLTGCSVVYDGQSRPCQVTLDYGWAAYLLVSDNLGISPARMAELRAQHPLLYWTESTWLVVGTVVAVLWAGLMMAALLLAVNKKPQSAVSIGSLKLPVWAVCALMIGLAVVANGVLGLLFVLPLGVMGVLVLLGAIIGLNRLDKKRGVAFAHPLMWAAVTLVVFWVVNLGTVFGLLTLGFVD